MRPLYYSLISISFTALFLCPAAASAHVVNYSAIQTNLTASGSTISLRTETTESFALTGIDSASQLAYFTNYFSQNFAVSYSGSVCSFAMDSVSTSTVANNYLFEGLYTCAAPVTQIANLQIHSILFDEYFPTLDHFVDVSIQGTQWEILFNKSVSEYPSQIHATLVTYFDRFLAVVQQFVWMGMMHIFTGYDHILFLFSIILLMRSLKKILLLITSFTIAHSITLLLASFHVVSVPSTIVEPLIALSIAYMALRNIMILRSSSAGNPPLGERWLSTFGFGLIHGLGFASALAETSIPQEFFVPSLVLFNVGIELGQLTILALLIPILLWIDKQTSANKILKYISVCILALALFWFFERLY